jgi:hypothetical protein
MGPDRYLKCIIVMLQEEIDQPDLKPVGDIEEIVTRRDREAPIGTVPVYTATSLADPA